MAKCSASVRRLSITDSQGAPITTSVRFNLTDSDQTEDLDCEDVDYYDNYYEDHPDASPDYHNRDS